VDDRAGSDAPQSETVSPQTRSPNGATGRGPRTIAVANQKGGVGKTTTAVNLGASLALAGERVVVVDLDPQGNASTALGIEPARRSPSSYDVITGNAEARSALKATTIEGLYGLPATVDLAGAEIELVGAFAREAILKRALEPLRDEATVVLVDCPPSLGLLTVNALCAADEVLVPIQCEYFALEGLGQLLKNLRLIQLNINPSLRLNGIVLTMYDARTKLAEQVVGEIRAYFGPAVYATVIPRSVRLSEAPGFGVPIAAYDPGSPGGKAYRSLAAEFLGRVPPAEPIGTLAGDAGPPLGSVGRRADQVDGRITPAEPPGAAPVTRVHAADRDAGEAGQGAVGAGTTFATGPALEAFTPSSEEPPERPITENGGRTVLAGGALAGNHAPATITKPRRPWWRFGRSKGESR
jgi:chromosome partitioning protein